MCATRASLPSGGKHPRRGVLTPAPRSVRLLYEGHNAPTTTHTMRCRMGFKAFFSQDGGKTFASNALVFATHDEAAAYSRDLYSRWITATNYEVRESTDPVNYRMTDSGAVPLNG